MLSHAEHAVPGHQVIRYNLLVLLRMTKELALPQLLATALIPHRRCIQFKCKCHVTLGFLRPALLSELQDDATTAVAFEISKEVACELL
jgi:hypothetical protein